MIAFQVGAGGTGGYIVNELVRILGATGEEHVYVVVDGDIVEERNLERQAFLQQDIDKNKAEALISRIETEDSPNVQVFGYTDFIYSWMEIIEIVTRLWELYEDQRDLVFICGADNNAVRHRIDLATKVLHELEIFDNILIVDSGNTEYTGEVLTTILKSGVSYEDNQLDYRLARIGGELDDRLTYGDFEMSCDLASESEPQNIGTNMLAGYVVLTSIIQWLELGEVESLNFNARTGLVSKATEVSQTEYVDLLENSPKKEEEQEYYNDTKTSVLSLIQ